MNKRRNWFARNKVILVILVVVLNAFIVSAIPIAQWRFDEGQGTITADATGNGNTGTLLGGVTWTTNSRSGYALHFDGTSGYVTTPLRPSLATQVRLEAWVKRDSTRDGTIVGKNGPYYLGIRGNKVSGQIYPTSGVWAFVNGTTELQVGQWYKLAMSYDGSELNVYVNDRLDGSRPTTGMIAGGSSTTMIGWGSGGNFEQFFHGTIDDVSVYNESRATPLLQVVNLGGTSISPIFRTPINPFALIFAFFPNQNYYLPNVPPETVVGDLTLRAPFFASRPYYLRYYFDLRDINTPLYYTFENFRFMSRMLYGTLHFDEITSFYIEAQNAQVTVPVVRASLGIPYYIQALAYDGNEFILSDGYRVLVPATP